MMNPEPVYYRQARWAFRLEVAVLFTGFFWIIGAFLADWRAAGFSDAWSIMNRQAAMIMVVVFAIRVLSSRIMPADRVSNPAPEEGAES